MGLKEETLSYHNQNPKGKISVIPSKPCATAKDLSLAYTPGVAYPCLEIKDNPLLAYEYTSKGNLVAVISNGTAVLGLGDIGALAGKPVMEGKGVLFKRFANVDVFDLEINEKNPQKFVEIVSSLSSTFGGINLEDIKAPECFYIETELQKKMDIPVFHDDQHGTSIIVAAALLNALEIAGKDLKRVKVVFNGAGAAAISSANLLLEVGLPIKNIFMLDSQGLITAERNNNEYKAKFAQQGKSKNLMEVIKGADVFIGLSKGNVLTKEMVRSMAKRPIVFAMANPTPEISYEDGKSAVPDIIMATGRSDYPNQVNNVLGFPYIFRGALDIRAKEINLSMKLAAVKALAELAKMPMDENMVKIYGKKFSFGSDYIIPKPFDPRVLPLVSTAVAKAAMESNTARIKIDDLNSYFKYLEKLSDKLAKGK